MATDPNLSLRVAENCFAQAMLLAKFGNEKRDDNGRLYSTTIRELMKQAEFNLVAAWKSKNP